MGCDGGTIPTRDELVTLKKKPEKKDSDGDRIYKWQHCALTQHPLTLTGRVVACEMGRLYNKEAVIELLLAEDRQNAPAWSHHLKQLKDVVELDLSPNPAYTDVSRRTDAVGDGMYVDRLVSPWICPVTGLEMNGRFKFSFNFKTGKVIAERAVKILKNDPEEKIKYPEEDLVILNPEEHEIDQMNAMMIARRARVKAAKKAAKAAKKAAAGSSSSKDELEFKAPNPVASEASDGPVAKKMKKDDGKEKKDSKIATVAGPSDEKSDKKVFNMFAEQARIEKEAAMRPKKDMNFVKRSTDLSGVKKDVQKGNGSEIFKKLFTTHKDAQNLKRGNWVTFDPRYN